MSPLAYLAAWSRVRRGIGPRLRAFYGIDRSAHPQRLAGSVLEQLLPQEHPNCRCAPLPFEAEDECTCPIPGLDDTDPALHHDGCPRGPLYFTTEPLWSIVDITRYVD